MVEAARGRPFSRHFYMAIKAKTGGGEGGGKEIHFLFFREFQVVWTQTYTFPRSALVCREPILYVGGKCVYKIKKTGYVIGGTYNLNRKTLRITYESRNGEFGKQPLRRERAITVHRCTEGFLPLVIGTFLHPRFTNIAGALSKQ